MIHDISISCNVGKNLDPSGCDGALYERATFSAPELRLIRLRSGVKKKKDFICLAHKKKYLDYYAHAQKYCCNALQQHPTETRYKAEDEITLLQRDKAKLLDPSYLLIPGQKLCAKCKILLYKKFKCANILGPFEESSPSFPSQQTTTEDSIHGSQPSVVAGTKKDSDSSYEITPSPSCLASINKFLEDNLESPIDLTKLKTQSKNYFFDQFDKLCRVLGSITGNTALETSILTLQEESDYFQEIISQLQKYLESPSRSVSDKFLAVSVLPRSLSGAKCKEYFSISRRLVNKVRALTAESGILCPPDKKAGKSLDPTIVKAVEAFYYRQDVSKELAGKNNTVSVREDGKRIQKRKRLLLGNILYFYEEFMKKYPDMPISASKFASLRPKECVLANSAGMHNVCVCIYHENPVLMFKGAQLHKISNLKSATDCLKHIVCPDPTPECWLRTCPDCPDWTSLREILETALDKELLTEITFNQWAGPDRGELLTMSLKVEDFIDKFLQQIEELATHHFIFKAQAEFFVNKQSSLEAGEAVVVGDYAQNFEFVIQDCIQSAYFQSKQSTVHPFSCYYRDENGEIVQFSVVIISDYMDHSTEAVYTFQKKLLEELLKRIPNLKKIYYFSDGCAPQYKNKYNAANVWFHEKDFKVKAEWHYFATSHGKSACDGIGGTIKRLASLYCKQHTEPGSQVTTPRRLFEWAQEHVKGVTSLWVSSNEVNECKKKLETRFKASYAIEGILSSHCILPDAKDNFITIKRYSRAPTGDSRIINTAEDVSIGWEDVRGFVIFVCGDNWCLGYVEEKDESDDSILVNKLCLMANKLYDYVFTDECISIPLQSILLLPQPKISKKGSQVHLMAKDTKTANVLFKNWTM